MKKVCAYKSALGSKAQEAFEDLRITVIISETVVGLNICKLDLDAVSKLFKGGQAMTVAEDSHVDSKHRIPDIFVTKNSLNILAIIFESVK